LEKSAEKIIAGGSKKASEGWEEELNQSSQDHFIGYFKGLGSLKWSLIISLTVP